MEDALQIIRDNAAPAFLYILLHLLHAILLREICLLGQSQENIIIFLQMNVRRFHKIGAIHEDDVGKNLIFIILQGNLGGYRAGIDADHAPGQSFPLVLHAVNGRGNHNHILIPQGLVDGNLRLLKIRL